MYSLAAGLTRGRAHSEWRTPKCQNSVLPTNLLGGVDFGSISQKWCESLGAYAVGPRRRLRATLTAGAVPTAGAGCRCGAPSDLCPRACFIDDGRLCFLPRGRRRGSPCAASGRSWASCDGPAVRGRDDKDVDAALGIERALFITLEPPFSGRPMVPFGAALFISPPLEERMPGGRLLACWRPLCADWVAGPDLWSSSARSRLIKSERAAFSRGGSPGTRRVPGSFISWTVFAFIAQNGRPINRAHPSGA